MKVLTVWSSPNADGLTASAKNAFIEGLKKGGAEVEEIWLNRKHLEHCHACGNGWGTCRSEGTCALKDDFAEIYQKIAEADGVAFVSAVYYGDLTEAFKALFDRMRRCDATHNHLLAEKRVILAACAGGTGRGTTSCLNNMEQTLAHMGVRTYDRIGVIRYNKDYMLPALTQAGEVYVERLETGFDMYY